jgi:hypothetical protein
VLESLPPQSTNSTEESHGAAFGEPRSASISIAWKSYTTHAPFMARGLAGVFPLTPPFTAGTSD